jgi:glycosyltransferase involved in cell wall biosynthesis
LKLSNVYDSYCLAESGATNRRLWEGQAKFVSAFNVHVLLNELAEFQPQVVYLWHLIGIGGLGILGTLAFLGVPWVWHLEDCVPWMLCNLQQRLVEPVAAEFSRLVNGHFLVVSQRLAEEIASHGIKLNGPLEILPNWVRGARPSPRRHYYQPGNRLRIVSAGQVGRHKGIDLLIESIAILAERGYTNVSLDIFGEVTDGTFQRAIDARGVASTVTLRGACTQADLLARYARHEYDVFAFPTWEREPFGCAPLEAAAHGCVMLISQSCGIGEWFVDRVHCLKEPRTASSFAGALARIMDGAIRLETLGRRAAAVIWRDFHIDRLLPRIERTLYQASRQPRMQQGSASDAYRLAILAEHLAQTTIEQAA